MVTARLHPRPAGLPESVRHCGWCGASWHKAFKHECHASTPSPVPQGRAGVVKRPKAGSDTEAMLAALLCAAGYFDATGVESTAWPVWSRFRRQHPWGLALVPERGFTADVAFLAPRLLVEIKGLAHAAGRSKVRADVEREGLAVSLGWTVLPLTPESVRDGSAIALIAKALNQSARAEGGS